MIVDSTRPNVCDDILMFAASRKEVNSRRFIFLNAVWKSGGGKARSVLQELGLTPDERVMSESHKGKSDRSEEWIVPPSGEWFSLFDACDNLTQGLNIDRLGQVTVEA